MDLRLSDDQEQLREAARVVCSDHPLTGTSGPDAVARSYDAVADLGFLALRVPDEQGGLGLGMAEAVCVAEELGAALAPTALLTTHLAHTWIPAARDGEWRVGSAYRLDEEDDRWLGDALGTLTHLAFAGSDLRLVVVPSLPEPPVETLDPLAAVRTFPEPAPGAVLAVLDGAALERYRLDEATLRAAYQVGVAQQVLERSVRYVGERQQFGKPVGSFQAVKHILADIYVGTEVARSAVWASAAALDDEEFPAAQRLAPSAARLANQVAANSGRKAVQVHGGMGFAWEVDIHLFLKRAWSLGATAHRFESDIQER